MKVAFTTSDKVHINAHFGSAQTLAIYDVNTEGYELVENLEFSGDLKQDGNEDKLLPKIEVISSCSLRALTGVTFLRIKRAAALPPIAAT